MTEFASLVCVGCGWQHVNSRSSSNFDAQGREEDIEEFAIRIKRQHNEARPRCMRPTIILAHCRTLFRFVEGVVAQPVGETKLLVSDAPIVLGNWHRSDITDLK
jgi:hypothetical protein